MRKFSKYLILMILILTSIMTLAACSKIEFKVQFVVDGEIYHTINTNGDEVVKMPNDPTKEGYNFDGWVWDKDVWKKPFTANSLLEAPLSENLNVYAKWIASNNSVIFNGNGSTSGSMANQTVASDTEAILNTNTYIKEGYTFVGWATSAGEEVVYTDSSNYTMGTNSSYTLYAKWIASNNSVIFNGNGSTSGSMANQTVASDTEAILNTNTYIKEGYTFVGWATSAGEEVVYTDSSNYTMGTNSSYTLYAKWTAINYSIAYELNDGINNANNPNTYTIEDLGGADGRITLQSPTKETDIVILSTEYTGNGEYLNDIEMTAYTFLGWYTGTDFTNQVNDIILDLGTVTLYAKWSSTTTTTTTTTAYQRINANNQPDNNGSYILFGEYPQTIKANNVSVGTTVNAKGYYLGSDGHYYTKVTATPNNSDYTFSSNATVTSGTVYYFKVEPIKWRILSESNGTALILCESIIANKAYYSNTSTRTIDGKTIFSNNYEHSDIRAWLNNEFYNTAFSELQQELIQITNVDNSENSTGYSPNKYACANTNDKIFLPSYREVTNTSNGFNSDASRRRQTSDFSRATGAYMNTDSSYYGNGYWWLRSPSDYGSYYARCVRNDGYVYGNYVYLTNFGVVPALTIRLS